MELFGRTAQVDLRLKSGEVLSIPCGAGGTAPGLRCAFATHRDDTRHVQMLELSIWNLSASTRAKVALPCTVTLSAGFAGSPGVIFAGPVYDFATERKGADTILKLKATEAYAASIAVSKRGPAPWSVVALAVARAAAEAIGLRLGDAAAVIARASAPEYPRGYSCAGPALRELERVLAPAGLRASVQLGELRVTNPGDVLGAGQVVELSAQIGLLGSPTLAPRPVPGQPPPKDRKGHTLRVLLHPRIAPGMVVAVRSTTLTGQFKVRSVSFVGDTGGDSWYSEVEVWPA